MKQGAPQLLSASVPSHHADLKRVGIDGQKSVEEFCTNTSDAPACRSCIAEVGIVGPVSSTTFRWLVFVSGMASALKLSGSNSQLLNKQASISSAIDHSEMPISDDGPSIQEGNRIVRHLLCARTSSPRRSSA